MEEEVNARVMKEERDVQKSHEEGHQAKEEWLSNQPLEEEDFPPSPEEGDLTTHQEEKKLLFDPPEGYARVVKEERVVQTSL